MVNRPLAAGAASATQQEAVWKHGALGVISSQTNRPEAFDAPDQVAWGRLPYEAKGVVMISPRRGRWLQKRLAAGESLRVRVDIEAVIAEPPRRR